MNNPNVLVIADKTDTKLLMPETDEKNWTIFWKTVNYDEVFMNVSEIDEFVNKNDIDFVVYSRNDQVAHRISIGHITAKLKTGYSSFSGIDEKFRINQMCACFKDFTECDKQLIFNLSQEQGVAQRCSQNGGTFSLIFDAEQLGCFRYGIPRIMKVLGEYNVKVTFFVTNVMKKVYSNAIESVRQRGHEVGIHGRWHEYLSDLDVATQTELINKMKTDFCGYTQGANFIGRMDAATVPALVANHFEYFVYPAINYYHPFRYPKLSSRPFSILTDGGRIWALPISVETYGLPWFSIKNMVDSAVAWAREKGFPHISILLHPFRDGNLYHLGTTQRLINYLVMNKGLSPITLKQLVNSLEPKIRLPSVNYEEFEAATRSKRALLFPETKQDFLGIFENFVRAYKLIRKNHGVF